MNKLDAMKTFATVAEEGGFSAAGRRLSMSRSAVNRQVIALEEDLGVQLLNRSTRRVSLTENGLVYLERCRAILSDIDEADRTVARLQAEPTGALRINAPMSFGITHLARPVAAFMARHAALRVQLTLNDRFVDPYEEGFDLTVRIGALPDSDLMARRLAPVRRVFCAAPAYIARHGRPACPRALRDHRCLHYGYLSTGTQWVVRGPGGEERVQVNDVLSSNSGEALRVAALEGLGIAMLPSFTVGEDLNAGRLVTVLDDYAPTEIAAYAIYPPNRFLTAKVRLFIDFLADWFRDTPPDAACMAAQRRA
ncbi:LysR family transcriptional regulator [Kaustia mangrovi]|uniref:LysR family transcriptional regulator n=1 Tax=Kaustia mangrovi TaxID=2593653 RepID=A0A7S8HCR9_9HYPH|nr:LysR family transcriptional regulator [Kaustia mangrovi]QPC43739.1 LysR family transcriptional regulator [Kaustia mangrovi]